VQAFDPPNMLSKETEQACMTLHLICHLKHVMADASPQTNMIANTFCDLNTCDLFCDLKACDVRYFTHRRCDKGRKLWLTSFRQPHTAVVREVDSVPPHTPADSGKISCPSPPGKGKDFGLIR